MRSGGARIWRFSSKASTTALNAGVERHKPHLSTEGREAQLGDTGHRFLISRETARCSIAYS